MNLPQDVIIDVGLNVAGYVLSGLIAIVIYTMFSRKHKGTPAIAGQASRAVLAETPPLGHPAPPVEFVRFGDGRRTERVAEPRPKMSVTERRNIVETIAAARRMMQAGTSADQIKKTLPISDAELALLKFEIER